MPAFHHPCGGVKWQEKEDNPLFRPSAEHNAGHERSETLIAHIDCSPRSFMQHWTQYRGTRRFALIGGAGCTLIIVTCLLLFSQGRGQKYLHDDSAVATTDTGLEDIPELDSWPYVEVVQPDDENVWPYRVFRSSAAAPPNLNITVDRGDIADGYIFITPGNRSSELTGQHQGGPFIIGADNELVYRYEETLASHDFRVQEINGEPHLLFWHGERAVGHGYGNLVILDSEYQETRLSFSTPMNWVAGAHRHPPGWTDFHENQVTPRGTIMMTTYNETSADLTAIGGTENGALLDSMFVELDIKTGQTVFTWSALEHVPVSASKLPLKTYMGNGKVGTPWDHFHINSIQDLPEGILISGRHTWSVYLVSHKTGEIIWTLDGSGDGSGDFAPLPKEDQFSWQHHARIYGRTDDGSLQLSLFDNHFVKQGNRTRPTRGLLLELPNPSEGRTRSPHVIASLETSEAVYCDSQGSIDATLPNGNIIVGHGPVPLIREYGPPREGADLRWEARFGYNDRAMTYRAFKSAWHGTPRVGAPSLVMEKSTEKASAPGYIASRAYISWNGATDVEAWNVYMKSPSGAKLTGRAARRGFETVLDVEVPEYSPCIQIAALQAGIEIRYSNVVCLP